MTQLLWIILIKDYYDKKVVEKLFSRKTGSHLNADLWSQHFQGCYSTSAFYFHKPLTSPSTFLSTDLGAKML